MQPIVAQQHLGRYRLDSPLGGGGMAEVWRATDTRLGRTVAIKMILPALASQPRFLERFWREARVVAALEHPNILPIYDFGEHDGAPFLVMPYLDGGTLALRVGLTGLPPEVVVPWVAQLGDALDTAHGVGVLHRDVKPGNVLMDRHDRPVLSDFGIARRAGVTSDLTATGAILGTPSYMAPELASGESASTATDLYALGVLTYEMLSGNPPFGGENPVAVLHQHVTRPVPPLSNRIAGIPPRVDEAFSRLLAKDVAMRPKSGRALAGELADALGQPLPAATTPLAAARLAPGRSPRATAGANTASDPKPASRPDRAPGAPASNAAPQSAAPSAPDTEPVFPAPPGRRGPRTAVAAILLLLAGGLVVALALRGAGDTPAARPHPSEGLPAPAAEAAREPTALADADAVGVGGSRREDVPLEVPVVARTGGATAPTGDDRVPGGAKPAGEPLPPSPPTATAPDGEASAGRVADDLDLGRHGQPSLRSFAEQLRRPRRLDAEAFRRLDSLAAAGLRREPHSGLLLALRAWARGGLAYATGDDGPARAAVDELRAALAGSARTGTPSWLLRDDVAGLALADWELAVLYGDARGVGLGLVEQHLSQRPSDVRGRFVRAQLRHIAGDHEGALADAREVHRRLDGVDRAAAGGAALAVGDELADLGRWSEALAASREAVRRGGPTAATAGLVGGQIALERLRDRASALEMFRAACDAGQPLGCRRAASLERGKTSPRRRSR